MPSLTTNAYELHFLAGIIISIIFRKNYFAPLLLIAYAKEIYDFFGSGTVDFWDFVWTVYGGILKEIPNKLLKP